MERWYLIKSQISGVVVWVKQYLNTHIWEILTIVMEKHNAQG